MNNSIFKELKNSVFNKKFQNIGYLPRWIIFAIDITIVAISVAITYLIIDSLSVKYNSVLERPYRASIILLVNAMFFMIYRTYAGIIRHSTFIDGVKLLVATTSSYLFILV